MSKQLTQYRGMIKKSEESLSDLALKGIKKSEQFLGTAKNAVKVYKKHPNYFKLAALATVGLIVYLSSGNKNNESDKS